MPDQTSQAPVAGADPRADGWRALAERLEKAAAHADGAGCFTRMAEAAAALRDAAEAGTERDEVMARLDDVMGASVRRGGLEDEWAAWSLAQRVEFLLGYTTRNRDAAARERARAALAAERMPASRARHPAAARSAPRAAPRTAGAPGAPTGPLVFVLPMPPLVTNCGIGRSRHWRSVDRERRAYLAACDALQLTGKLPPPPARPFRRASLRVDMVVGAANDDDNAVARQKFAVDWLVSRGYLLSDRRTCLTRDGYPTQRVTRKEPASLTLTLTPLTP